MSEVGSRTGIGNQPSTCSVRGGSQTRRFPSLKIDQSMRDILHSTEDDYPDF